MKHLESVGYETRGRDKNNTCGSNGTPGKEHCRRCHEFLLPLRNGSNINQQVAEKSRASWRPCSVSARTNNAELQSRMIKMNLHPSEEGFCNPSSTDGAAAKRQEISFYYDVQKEECVRFNYHGCGGNDNNFRTMGGCNLTCFCVQATVAKASASCPDSIECSCGNFVVEEGGCRVCDCKNTAPKKNAGVLAAALAISALIATTLFSP
ncbi:tissue factor pathway inhibitor-like [Dermacentor albipictus]|uniref:tissue factor pathway inhibitor-like n=1 Tax=Dermacentor albipictus TaxID=60249 RepID=UPI0038FBF30A